MSRPHVGLLHWNSSWSFHNSAQEKRGTFFLNWELNLEIWAEKSRNQPWQLYFILLLQGIWTLWTTTLNQKKRKEKLPKSILTFDLCLVAIFTKNDKIEKSLFTELLRKTYLTNVGIVDVLKSKMNAKGFSNLLSNFTSSKLVMSNSKKSFWLGITHDKYFHFSNKKNYIRWVIVRILQATYFYI